MRKDDGLPTNICHSCLYSTEQFYEFRRGVHSCERQLREFIQTLAIQTVNVDAITMPSGQSQQTLDESDEQNDVVVIDPMKCYETSAGEESDGDVVEVNPVESADKAKYELLATMYNRLALPPSATGSPIAPNPSAIDATDNFRNILFCKYCEAAFTDRKQCEAHEKNNHDPVSPFACNFCPFRCETRFNVIAHIKQYHEPEKPYICVQCNKNFGRRADLKKHAVMHTGIRPFECPVCKKTFSRKSNVVKHMKTHAQQTVPVEPPKTHQCEICSSRFTNHEELNEHQLQHIQERYAQMQMEAWNQAQLYQKMQQQQQLQQPQQQQPFTPDISQAAAPTMTTTPSKAEPKYSIQCTPSTGGSHIPKLKLTKQKFACDKCEKVFATPTSLKSHKRVHAVLKPPKCITCNILFKTKRELQRHNLTHANESSKTTKSSKPKNTNQKKFQCSVCEKQFLRRDKLINHEKIHKNRKKTAALPESAFLPENLKRTHNMDNRSAEMSQLNDANHLQQLTPDMFRPQFYAEYDLSQT